MTPGQICSVGVLSTRKIRNNWSISESPWMSFFEISQIALKFAKVNKKRKPIHLKQRLSVQHLCKYGAQGPHIQWTRILGATQQDLRCPEDWFNYNKNPNAWSAVANGFHTCTKELQLHECKLWRESQRLWPAQSLQSWWRHPCRSASWPASGLCAGLFGSGRKQWPKNFKLTPNIVQSLPTWHSW